MVFKCINNIFYFAQVELVLTNVADEVTAHSVPIHPQKPELGSRVMRRYNKVSDVK